MTSFAGVSRLRSWTLQKEASLSSLQPLAFVLIFFRSRTCSHFRFRVSSSHTFLHSSDRFSWAGFVLSRQLDKKKFQPVVVSPRTYFVFTPLLASTAVGTLEFRTTLESVRARSTGVSLIFPLVSLLCRSRIGAGLSIYVSGAQKPPRS